MRKVRSQLILITFILCIFTIINLTNVITVKAETAQVTTQNGGSVNVRTGPGLDYSVIDLAASYEPLTVIEKFNDYWAKITVKSINNKIITGYMATQFITYNDLKNANVAPASNSVKHVALTFDDGPNSSLTPKLLDALNKYNAKATFLLVGQMVSYYPNVVKMINDYGMEIGNHSYDHSELTYLSQEDINWEITQTSDNIRSITGNNPTLFRPPYGSHNKLSDSICANYNLPVLLWSVDTEDWKYKNSNTVYNHIASNLRDGAVILVHDIHPTTVEAAIAILRDYSKKGYEFVTVSELARIHGIPLSPGQSYYSF